MHEQIKRELGALINRAKQGARYYERSVPIPQDENVYIKLAGQLISALDQFREHDFAD